MALSVSGLSFDPLKVQQIHFNPFHVFTDEYMRFNNAVLHYRDDLWLMVYRLYLGRPAGDTQPPGRPHRFHPWYTHWRGAADGTVVAVLQYDARRRRFSVVREFTLTFPPHLARFNTPQNQVQDVRICRLNGELYVYGQIYTRRGESVAAEVSESPTNDAIRECLSGDGSCVLVTVNLLQVAVTEDPKGVPRAMTVTSVQLPCLAEPSVYRQFGRHIIEKNWSFFVWQQRVYFEYGLHPHRVFSLDCRQHWETPNPLSDIKARLGCQVFFSPGSPLVDWDEHHWLGVGHVKYNYRCVTLLPLEAEATSSSLLLHPSEFGSYVYGLFFYLVAKGPPFALTRFTQGVVPRHAGQVYALVFPMGLAPLEPGQYLISYGEGDHTPQLAVWSRQRIAHLLAFQPTVENFTVRWLDLSDPGADAALEAEVAVLQRTVVAPSTAETRPMATTSRLTSRRRRRRLRRVQQHSQKSPLKNLKHPFLRAKVLALRRRAHTPA